MRAIKLHFPNATILTNLLSDETFESEIRYLSPYTIGANNIVLFDPVTSHGPLDTEIVVLSKFARAIKRVVFPQSGYNVELFNPIIGEQKGGLIHNSVRVIDSTDIEIASISITIQP